MRKRPFVTIFAAIQVILGSCDKYRYSPSGDTVDVDQLVGCGVVPGYGPPLQFIREMHDSLGLTLMLRHVKGHRSKHSSRHRLNARADGLARRSAQMEFSLGTA